MKVPLSVLVTAAAVCAGAATYVSVDFIQTDGYAYLDTGVAGNAKKIRQRAKFQLLDTPGSATAVGLFGSYGGTAISCRQSCAFAACWTSSCTKFWPAYSGSESEGYFWKNPAKNGWHDLYLHHGYAEDYDDRVACNPETGVGYNWNDLSDADFATLLVGNCHKADGTLHTPLGSQLRMRWYSYEIVDHDTGVTRMRLTPVKCVETGIFGMRDSVTRRFFASEAEGHPFIGPSCATWSGRSTAYAAGTVIRVPAGTTNVVTTADVATLNDLAGILVEDATSVFSFSNNTADSSIYMPFYGPGEIRFDKSERKFNLHADNRTFAGKLTVRRTGADLWSKYGLGWTNRLEYGTSGEGDRILAFHCGGAFAGPVRLTGTGGGSRIEQCGSDRYAFTGPVELDLDCELNVNGGNASIWFTGPVTGIGSVFHPIGTQVSVGFAGEGDSFFGRTCIRADSTLALGGRIHVDSRGYGSDSNPQEYGQVGAADGRTVRFTSANVLDTSVNFLMGWGYTTDPTPGGTVDLNGFDQRVGRLIIGVGGSITADTRAQATRLAIVSETPAKLRICNTAVFGHDPYLDCVPGCWPGRVNGAASVEIDTLEAKSDPGTVSFTCAGSDTTGGLYARRGTVKVYETASFSNLTELVASGTGRIDVLTPEIGLAGNLFVAVTNATTATLRIASGVTLVADTALMGGSWLKPGLYSSAARTGVAACPQLSGKGVLEVKRYGGDVGFSVFFH